LREVGDVLFEKVGDELEAGAAQVIVWHGAALTDQEILSKKFSANGQVVN
jgi:hypothetical protein